MVHINNDPTMKIMLEADFLIKYIKLEIFFVNIPFDHFFFFPFENILPFNAICYSCL